jgi:hypothetical protein
VIATSFSSADGPAGGVAAAGHRLSVGDLVIWREQRWIVTAMHSHPRLGRFMRLETGDGAYDLVHENGADGAIQPLTWASVTRTESCRCGLEGRVCEQYATYPGGRCRRCGHGERCHPRKRKGSK